MKQQKARNTFLTLLIPILILLYIFFGGSVGISLDFGEEALAISAEKQDWSLPYDQIISLELADAADFGVPLNSTEKRTLHYGSYENDSWGQYNLCIDPRIETCIVIETTNGFFVLNYENEESTQQLYIMFTQLLASKTDAVPTV